MYFESFSGWGPALSWLKRTVGVCVGDAVGVCGNCRRLRPGGVSSSLSLGVLVGLNGSVCGDNVLCGA